MPVTPNDKCPICEKNHIAGQKTYMHGFGDWCTARYHFECSRTELLEKKKVKFCPASDCGAQLIGALWTGEKVKDAEAGHGEDGVVGGGNVDGRGGSGNTIES